MRFDCRTIRTTADFYQQFCDKFQLSYFGCNTDALWDMLTAGMALHVVEAFAHITARQRRLFSAFIGTCRDAAEEWPGDIQLVLPPLTMT
ncbi:barstar family protein, partial [Morganella morganii]|uniref:barstar family protein n=1 Tax=Morganella morganii TaxID=582 RepID=UPI0031ED2DF9